jgi:hypothetical protein
MRVAQFRTDASGWTNISEESKGEACIEYSGWVRVSEYIEVTFPPLPPAVVVESQLKQIDAAEAELRTRFQEKLNELANERAKLLSLTHESAS